MKTQGRYHLQSIWELVSIRGVFENLSSFMWSHFPISSSHLREVSILLLCQSFCKRRPLLFKTPSINWKTESLLNLKKSEIFYGRQFHFAENLQVYISFVQGSLLFHEILHLREPLVGSLAFFILVLIKGGPVKITRKSTHRCARLICITWQYLHYWHFFQYLHYLHSYLLFIIFFTQTKFLENKIYTEKTR